MSYHPYAVWRRVALWSNSSLAATSIFWLGTFGICWYAGEAVMSLTNKRTFDPQFRAEIEGKMSPEQQVQTDMARRQLQKLFDDIQSGDNARGGWK